MHSRTCSGAILIFCIRHEIFGACESDRCAWRNLSATSSVWNRGADMVSALIPQIYFDYLRGGSPEPLVPIFHHNQMDLRGLAGLATRVLSLARKSGNARAQTGSSFSACRASASGEAKFCPRAQVVPAIDRSRAAAGNRSRRATLARASREARRRFRTRARTVGKHAGNSREGFEAYEQLAIHFEHRAREPHRAAELARKALFELRNAHRLGTIAPAAYRQRRARFEKRLVRLERKNRP